MSVLQGEPEVLQSGCELLIVVNLVLIPETVTIPPERKLLLPECNACLSHSTLALMFLNHEADGRIQSRDATGIGELQLVRGSDVTCQVLKSAVARETHRNADRIKIRNASVAAPLNRFCNDVIAKAGGDVSDVIDHVRINFLHSVNQSPANEGIST